MQHITNNLWMGMRYDVVAKINNNISGDIRDIFNDIWPNFVTLFLHSDSAYLLNGLYSEVTDEEDCILREFL